MTTVKDVLYAGETEGVQGLAGQLGSLGVLAAVLPEAVAPTRVAEAVWDLLDIPLGDLLVRGWEKHRLIEEAKKATDGQPGAIQQVRIAGHTLKSEHHPKIECDVDGRTIPLLTLRLVVSLTIDTLVVTVTEGQVAGMSPGKVKAVATLSAGGVELCRREVEAVSLV